MELVRRIGLVGIAAALAVAVVIALGDSTAAPAREPSAARGVPEPKVRFDPIPYKSDRKRQMANYSKRHYGKREWRLEDPRAIVLHYTASSSYSSVWSTFASNAPSRGERPGVCTQYVVDKDGTIYQLTRKYFRCRHAIGLNHVSLGVEMVQEELGGSSAERAILSRKKQIRSATVLVAWLRQRFRIEMRDVIGHAMANDSPRFKDREGWRNDHTDWRAKYTRRFRTRVGRVIAEHRDGASQELGGSAKSAQRGSDPRIVFGRSVEGRKLVAERLGPPDGRRTSLVVGEIHGDEEAGRAVIRRLRRDGAPRGATVWTVLSVNPDGHEANRRTNSRGVDLNRNFPVGWDGSEPRGSGYYAGKRPLSEPEARALKRLIKQIDPDVTIHYHQPWGGVLLPCGGPAPDQQQYARISGLPTDRCRGQRLPAR